MQLKPKAILPQHKAILEGFNEQSNIYCQKLNYLLIRYSLIKDLIEDELMLLNVLSEIDFISKH